jgi:hypothetical protein
MLFQNIIHISRYSIIACKITYIKLKIIFPKTKLFDLRMVKKIKHLKNILHREGIPLA